MSEQDYNPCADETGQLAASPVANQARFRRFGLSLVRAGTTIFGVSLAGATFLAFLARIEYRLDLLTNFRLQYAIGLVLVLGFAFAFKTRWLGILAAAAFLTNALLIAPVYLPSKVNPGAVEGATYRLLQANVRTDNRSFNSLRLLVEEEAPDFILLLEVNQGWINELALHELGYTQENLWPLENNFGIGLFGKIAAAEQGFFQAENARFPAVYGSYNLPEGPLKIFGAHPPPPLSPGGAEARNREIRLAFNQAAQHTGPRILAADFNATTWSATLAQELAGSNLRDSRLGFGLQPSWPTYLGLPFRIPIDHIFVSQEIIVIDRRLGPHIGSDHLPVVMDFNISN